MKRASLLGLALVAVYAAPSHAQVGSFGLGSRAIALGNAFTGVADDLSATYYNPAGLTQLIDGGVDSSFGVGLNGVRLSYREPVVDELSNVAPNERLDQDPEAPDWIFLPSLNFGLELSDDLYLTPLTILVPFAAAFQYSPTEGDARFGAVEVGNLAATWSPSIAYRVTPWLSIGAGFDLVVATDYWQKTKLGDGAVGRAATAEAAALLGLPGTPDVPSFLSTRDGIDDGDTLLASDRELPTGISPFNSVNLDFETWGYHFGVMLFPTEWLRLGFLYRSALEPEIEGTIQTRFQPDIQERSLFQLLGVRDEEERFRLALGLPRTVSAGASAQLGDQWLVAAAWWWEDWPSAKGRADIVRVGGDGLNASILSPGLEEIVVPREGIRSQHQLRLGLEWRPAEVLRVMSGLWYAPTSVPDSAWDFTQEPGDRITYSGGLGLVGLFDGKLDIHAHVQWNQFQDRRVSVGESRILGGTRELVLSPDSGSTLVPNDTFAVTIGGALINWGITVDLRL